VTVSHPPGGRLPLLSARPAVTSPAAEHHRPLAGTKLYCLVTRGTYCWALVNNLKFYWPMVLRGLKCVSVPDFTNSDWTVAELWRFSKLQDPVVRVTCNIILCVVVLSLSHYFVLGSTSLLSLTWRVMRCGHVGGVCVRVDTRRRTWPAADHFQVRWL